jgi:hypothetical protein
MMAPRIQWNDRATLPQLDEVFRIMRGQPSPASIERRALIAVLFCQDDLNHSKLRDAPRRALPAPRAGRAIKTTEW